MGEHWFNIEYGINHVLDIKAIDHVLFLTVLVIPFLFSNWKRVFYLVSMFTIGHTLSLILASYNIVKLNGTIIELCILLSILATAIFNILFVKRIETFKSIQFVITLIFGVVHGFGFAGEFAMFSSGTTNKGILLLEFALGIEIAQLIAVFIVLFIGFLLQTIISVTKRDWILVTSSIVLGFVLKLLIDF